MFEFVSPKCQFQNQSLTKYRVIWYQLYVFIFIIISVEKVGFHTNLLQKYTGSLLSIQKITFNPQNRLEHEGYSHKHNIT